MAGLRVPDLSSFRNASLARKVNVTFTGGDVYIAAPQISDMAVLWGEIFGSKERKFLRELLSEATLCFSLKDTYQIHVRTLWHAGHMTSALQLATGMRRKGMFALLLHDLVGDLTTSWTWTKMIRPLHRVGFSVIAVDLPGFGKSAVAQVCACPRSRWAPQEAHVISKIMEEQNISRCQCIVVGQSCGILLNVLQSAPHRLASQHVLVNPVFDRHTLFTHLEIQPPPGAQAGWQDVVRERQQAALIELFRTSGVRLWCIFDREDKRSKGEAPSKEMQKEWEMSLDTREMLIECSRDEIVCKQVKITYVSKNDLCEVQAGKRVPVRIYMPSRHLKASIANYLAQTDGKKWEMMFTPSYVGTNEQTRKASKGVQLEEAQSDDEEPSSEEDNEGNRGRSQQDAAQARAENSRWRMLQDRGQIDSWQKGAQEREAKKREAQEKQELQRLAEEQEAKRRAATEKRMQEKKGQLAPRLISGQLAKSDTDLMRQTGHTLSGASIIAKGRLKSAGTQEKPQIVTAETHRDMKTMNWTKVPYEASLSYGVRKMFLDAFENSVHTYAEEQEKEYETRKAHHHRTAIRSQSSSNLQLRDR